MPWIVLTVLEIIVYVLRCFFSDAFSQDPGTELLNFVSYFILPIYFLIVIYSLYKEIKNDSVPATVTTATVELDKQVNKYEFQDSKI